MSRRKDNYETSRWLKFKKWVDGETDPLKHRDGAEANLGDNETSARQVFDSAYPNKPPLSI